MTRSERTSPDERADSLGGEKPVERGSFRDRVRSRPVLGYVWRVSVFLLGFLCIAAGLALSLLPGPLTIPPVLLGLWIWSTEFEWAHKLFAKFKEKGKDAWAHAKKHPVSSTAITIAGLAMAGVAVWAVGNYQLVDRAKELVGLA